MEIYIVLVKWKMLICVYMMIGIISENMFNLCAVSFGVVSNAKCGLFSFRKFFSLKFKI